MRAVAVASVSSALTLGLVGCGGSDGPTSTVAPTPAPLPKDLGCLCVFSFDRVLTTHPGQTTNCTGSKVVAGGDGNPIHDYAWGCQQDGPQCALTWSVAAVNYAQTDCGKCYSGLATRGGKGTPDEAKALADLMPNTPSKTWGGDEHDPSACLAGQAAFIEFCADAVPSVKSIQAYYKSQGIDIADADVYYFADTSDQVNEINNSTFNGKEVSCASRDSTSNPGSTIGECGATVEEISTATKGVSTCDATETLVNVELV